MADDDDIDLKPKKKALKPKSRRVPARFQAASRIVKMISLAIGAFIAIIGFMSIFGLVLDNSIARLILALIPTLGLGLFIVDRLLKRYPTDDRGSVVLDVFAVLLLAESLLFIALGGVTHGAFTKEGDRYAKTGSRGFARAAYLFGGKSPSFDDADAAKNAPAGSSSGAPSASSSSRGGH